MTLKLYSIFDIFYAMDFSYNIRLNKVSNLSWLLVLLSIYRFDMLSRLLFWLGNFLSLFFRLCIMMLFLFLIFMLFICMLSLNFLLFMMLCLILSFMCSIRFWAMSWVYFFICRLFVTGSRWSFVIFWIEKSTFISRHCLIFITNWRLEPFCIMGSLIFFMSCFGIICSFSSAYFFLFAFFIFSFLFFMLLFFFSMYWFWFTFLHFLLTLFVCLFFLFGLCFGFYISLWIFLICSCRNPSTCYNGLLFVSSYWFFIDWLTSNWSVGFLITRGRWFGYI